MEYGIRIPNYIEKKILKKAFVAIVKYVVNRAIRDIFQAVLHILDRGATGIITGLNGQVFTDPLGV